MSRNEWALVMSRISTDYYKPYKTHEGLQYQSVVTDKSHFLYIYEDGGFNHYSMLAKIDYANEDIANEIKGVLDNGTFNEISSLINAVVGSDEVRRGGYSVYNTRTGGRSRTRGNGTVHKRQSKRNAGETNGRGSRNAEVGRKDEGRGAFGREWGTNGNGNGQVKLQFVNENDSFADDTDGNKKVSQPYENTMQKIVIRYYQGISGYPRYALREWLFFVFYITN